MPIAQTRNAIVHQRLQFASQLIEAGDCENAALVLQKAVELAPQSPAVHTALGNVLSALGRHIEAVDAYTEAIESRPDYAGAFMGLAVVCFAVGDPEQGRDLLEDASGLTDGPTRETLPSADEIIDEYGRATTLPEFRRAAIMARLRAFVRMRCAVKLCCVGA